MKEASYTRIMKAVGGKTISYYKGAGEIAKIHSITGPAVVYSEQEAKASEYYLFGIRYSKIKWQELVNQQKAVLVVNAGQLEYKT